MTDIKVPIGRGVAQFVPEVQKPQAATNEGDWLKRLADEGKLISVAEATNSDNVEFLTFTPNNGETFYLISASASVTDSTTSQVRLRINADIVERVQFSPELQTIPFKSTGLSVIGDGINTMNMFTTAGASGALFGYIENTPVRSSRGTTQVRQG